MSGAVFLTPIYRPLRSNTIAGTSTDPAATNITSAYYSNPPLEESDPTLPQRRRRSTTERLKDPLRFHDDSKPVSPWAGALVLPASMASLIFAAGFLVHNKVKASKEKKREKKRKVHEEWYEDLQREHSRGAEKRGPEAGAELNGSPRSELEGTNTGSTRPDSDTYQPDTGKAEAVGSNVFEAENPSRRSSESQRSRDDPSRWVEDVIKQRSKSLGAGGV